MITVRGARGVGNGFGVWKLVSFLPLNLNSVSSYNVITAVCPASNLVSRFSVVRWRFVGNVAFGRSVPSQRCVLRRSGTGRVWRRVSGAGLARTPGKVIKLSSREKDDIIRDYNVDSFWCHRRGRGYELNTQISHLEQRNGNGAGRVREVCGIRQIGSKQANNANVNKQPTPINPIFEC